MQSKAQEEIDAAIEDVQYTIKTGKRAKKRPKAVPAPPAHNPDNIPRGTGPGEVWIDFEADAQGMVTIADFQVAPIETVYEAYRATFPGKVTPLEGGKFKVVIPIEVLKQASPIIRSENKVHAAQQRAASAMIVRDEELLSGQSMNKIFHGKRIGIAVNTRVEK